MTESMDFIPSTLEVEYDKNLTNLYKAITDQDWDRAVDLCKQYPEQAKTWVVRRYEDHDDDAASDDIMWRFLPLHSACARQPPMAVVAALLRAYADGAKCKDDQGMYALHYACGNQATRDVVRMLLVSYPEAAKKADPRGMLPIHYLACWGPSSVSVVDMLLVANPDVATIKDAEGKTPMDLAREGEYPEKTSVIAVLQKWFHTNYASDASDHELSRSSSRQSQGSQRKLDTSNEYGNPISSSAPRHRSSSRSRGMTMGQTASTMTQEEKKDDDSSYLMNPLPNKGDAALMVELGRLRDQLQTVETEKTLMAKRLSEANRKCQLQEEEILDLQQELSHAKMSKSQGNQEMADTERELERTQTKLRGCMEELKGLRINMVDMMEEHEDLKRKNTNTKGRISSLSVSLEGLMSEQKDLAKIIRSSAAARKTSYAKRKENMKALLEMEESHEAEDEALETKLKKQSKEMEALQAMIEAARD